MGKLVEIVLCRLMGDHLPDHLVRFGDVGVARAKVSRQCRTAVHEHTGYVAAHHAHHESGQILVAGADGKNAVPLMCPCGGLDTVGNQFARHQREAHAGVGDGQAVGH